MAANIEQNDWMFFGSGVKPWHGIGTVVDGVLTSDEALHVAKLDWTVEQEPVVCRGKEIPDVFANVREDTGDVLGVVKNKYTVLQNTDSFSFVDGIIKNTQGVDCHYETAGSLFNGKRIFLLVRLPDTNLVGDDVENYLFFSNSHDGSTSSVAGITNIRIVCNNTLQLAESTAKRIWRTRHTKTMNEKQMEAARALNLAVEYQHVVEGKAFEMASRKVDEEAFFRTFFDVFDMSEKAKQSTLLSIRDIYTQKDDLQNFRGSAWGLYNAVADFVSNRPQRKTTNGAQWKMAGFMDGYAMLDKTQAILCA